MVFINGHFDEANIIWNCMNASEAILWARGLTSTVRKSDYIKLDNMLARGYFCGRLGSQHMIRVAAMSGLIPFGFLTFGRMPTGTGSTKRLKIVHNIKTPDSLLYYLHREMKLPVLLLENLICKFQQWEKKNCPHEYDKGKNATPCCRTWYDVIYPGQKAILSVDYDKQETVKHSFDCSKASSPSTFVVPVWSGVFNPKQSHDNIGRSLPSQSNWHLLPWSMEKSIKSNAALKRHIIRCFREKDPKQDPKPDKRKRVTVPQTIPRKRKQRKELNSVTAGCVTTHRSTRIIIGGHRYKEAITMGRSKEKSAATQLDNGPEQQLGREEKSATAGVPLHAVGLDEFVSDPLLDLYNEDVSDPLLDRPINNTNSGQVIEQVRSIIDETMMIPSLQKSVSVDLFHVAALALGTTVHQFNWETCKHEGKLTRRCYGHLLAGTPPEQTTVAITEDHQLLFDQQVGHMVDDTGRSRVLYVSMKAMKRATLLYAAFFVGDPTKWMSYVFKQPLLFGETGVVYLEGGVKDNQSVLYVAGMRDAGWVRDDRSVLYSGPPFFVVHNHNGTYYYAVFAKNGLLQQPRLLFPD